MKLKALSTAMILATVPMTGAFAAAMEHVDRNKQDRLRATASIYLSKYPTHLQPRFDVIEIYAPDGTETLKPEIRHLEDAFQ